MLVIIAIDPGTTESAYCVMRPDYTPIEKGKVPNTSLLAWLYAFDQLPFDIGTVVIEMIASYGMRVGQEVFDTCVWIGRFTEAANQVKLPVEYVFRREEKLNICGTMTAKDANIRQALIDRFGIVGKKAAPGFFYGFRADIWSAFAVGTTYLDRIK